jgi:GntR family transcriptional regulator
LEFDGAPALYYQIKQQIKRSIEGGELAPGAPLPSEISLCEVYGVSRPTVRQAMKELISEGLLERRRGVGTFVAQPKLRHPLGSVVGFSERVERAGQRPGTRVLQEEVLGAGELGDDVVEALETSAEDPVLRVVRLRLVDDEPLLVETVHLPLARFPGLELEDLEQRSLYRTLRERYGVEINHLKQTLSPVVLGEHEAELLGTAAGGPGARTVLVTYDRSGRPVEYTFALVRGDRCEYHVELGAGERAEYAGIARLCQTQLEVAFKA